MTNFPSTLARCAANFAFGPTSMAEFARMRNELDELRMIAALYASTRGWPAVAFEGYRVREGLAGWTEFLMADFVITHDPTLIGEAMLAIDIRKRP